MLAAVSVRLADGCGTHPQPPGARSVEGTALTVLRARRFKDGRRVPITDEREAQRGYETDLRPHSNSTQSTGSLGV